MGRRKNVLVAYAGVRELTDGKKGYKYYDIEKDEYSLFSKKLKGVSVGCVFQIGHVDNDSWGGGYTFPDNHVKRYDDRELVTSWDVEHRAALLSFQLKSEAKKEHAASLESLVKQMKEAMYAVPSIDRAKVALWVYNKLIG